MERLTRFAMDNAAVVLLGTALLFIGGLYAFSQLTIEAFPDPTDTQVNVITAYPGQPAEEVERQISVPLERALNGTPGLASLRCINLFGLSYMSLTFRDGVEPLFARAQALERLRLAELPDGVLPQLGSLSTPIGEIYRYSLVDTDGSSDPIELRTMQDWVVRPRLLQVDGVADVVTYGGLLRQIHVRPDPVLLAAKGLTLQSLETALAQASENASGGVIERGAEQLVIRSEGLFTHISDISRVSVGSFGGTPVPLSAVASVQEGWAPRQGVYSRGADLDAVEGIVLMRRGENPSVVLGRLRAKLEDIHKSGLPAHVRIDPFYDRTELVDATLATVFRNLVEGALLVILVLWVFMRDVRAAMIVATVIPLALVCTFIYLNARGMTANLLSMGAVDFGIIIDGAVVIIENVVHRLTWHQEYTAKVGDVRGKIRQAVTDVARPTLFAQLIIIAAYLPLFLLQRVEGRIFAPMAHTVVAALVGALVLSVTLVPVLAALSYRKGAEHKESFVLRAASRIYRPLLVRALRVPRLVLVAATLALCVSGVMLSRLGSEFLPELNEGALYLTFSLPGNASLTEGRRMIPVLSKIISEVAEVEAYSSQLGRPEDGTDATLATNLEFFVRLKPMQQWSRDTKTISALIEKMNAKLGTIPGLDVNFSQPIRDNVNENISGQPGQVALKLYSNDVDNLQAVAERTKAVLQEVPGIADLGIVKSGSVPSLSIRPRRESLGRFGLSMDDVQHFLSTAVGGRAVGTFWERDRSFEIVLRFPDAAREDIEHISALRVPTAQGALVPLNAISDIQLTQGRASINRENGQRYLGIRMNVRGRDLGSFVNDARARVERLLEKTPGVAVSWGGEFESKERAMKRLALVLPLTLVLTLALLFGAFRSLQLALLVMVAVPFALIGGAVGLWAFAMPLSVAAAVGFIALIGQASLNGVLVVAEIQTHRKNGADIDDAILSGSLGKLRPVLMTGALAALGLVPAALSTAMGAETQRPIAVVIVGGSLSAAVLTLLVLPVMYKLWARSSRFPHER